MNKKLKNWRKDYRGFIRKKMDSCPFKYCTAYSEGQYSVLDDEKDNDENMVPEIEGFIESLLEEVIDEVGEIRGCDILDKQKLKSLLGLDEKE